jgi:hypothetical protein
MSTDPTARPSGAETAQGAGPADGQPSEAELRAAYEAELSRISSADLMLQAAVSLLNVGSYRLAPRAPGSPGGPGDPPGASPGGAPPSTSAPIPPSADDLEQARDAIDGARALLDVLERSVPNEIAPLRNALSQLQVAYARAVQAAGGAPGTAKAPGGKPPEDSSTPTSGGTGNAGGDAAPGSGKGTGEQGRPGPGPAESSGRLWVPGR